MTDETDETTYELSDLEVVTLGLVSRAAVGIYGDGENVFLVKNDKESAMTDELEIEEVTDPSPSFWQKMESMIQNVVAKAKVSKPDPKAIAQAVGILRGGGYDISPDDLAGMLDDMEEDTADQGADEGAEMKGKTSSPHSKKPGKMQARKEEVTEKGANEPVNEEENTTTEVVAAVEKAHIEAIIKSIQDQHEKQLETVTKAIEEKYEAKITGLTERVTKAEEDKQAADEARERREFVEKAIGYRTLPVKHSDLGELLYKLSKGVDAETYTQIESLLKAADNQLGAAGIFGEYGTSRTPEEVALEDKIEKTAKEGKLQPAEALLALSEEDQWELLKHDYSKIKGGK